MSNLPLYVFGAAGHAREVAAYFRALDPARPILFVDRAPVDPDCISLADYRARIASGEPGESILGSGRCNIRQRMLEEMLPPFATFIHPSAVVFGQVGPGCVIAPNAVVAPNAQIAAHVLVNYNATVGHDTQVGRLCVIGPTAAVGGFCRLDEQVYVGAGALIREQLVLGRGAIIGMGAVVTKGVGENQVVAGVPARELDVGQRERKWL